MSLKRITIRGLMVLVAAVGMVLGVGLGLRRRSSELRQLSDYHMGQWAAYENEHRRDPQVAGRLPDATLTRRAAWHWKVMTNYREASTRPWLPAAGDPPKPSPW